MGQFRNDSAARQARGKSSNTAVASFDLTATRDGRLQTPTAEGETYQIGYFHINIAEVRTEEGKLISSWPLTARASLPSRSWLRKRTARRPGSSWNPCSTTCPPEPTRS